MRRSSRTPLFGLFAGATPRATTWCFLLAVANCGSGGAGTPDHRGTGGLGEGGGGGGDGATDGAAGAAGGGGGDGSGGDASPIRAWAEWPMPNQPGVGLPNPQTYTVLTVMSEEVVRDDVTRLLWQRRPDSRRFTWADAVQHCKELTLAGWDDWRLPSRIELVSLLSLVHTDPSIDPDAFSDTPGEWFWTASRPTDNPDRAWFVYFYFGYPDTDPVENQYPARCVRSPAIAQIPAERYDVQTDVARDLYTRLTWQRAVPAGMSSFDAASAACADLNLGGRDDWRLPSLQEFQTIVDESRGLPAIDVAAFPDTPSSGFWSGTAWAGTPLLGWHVDFDTGSAAYDTRTTLYHVRCVRWEP